MDFGSANMNQKRRFSEPLHPFYFLFYIFVALGQAVGLGLTSVPVNNYPTLHRKGTQGLIL